MVTAPETILMIRAVLAENSIDETKIDKIEQIVSIYKSEASEVIAMGGEIVNTPKVQ